MELDNYIIIAYNYYPKEINISDEIYFSSPEFLLRERIIKKRDLRWENLISELKIKFGFEYVLDRTDNEIGYRCVVYIHKGELLYECIFHISKITQLYCYLIKELKVDKIKIETVLLSQHFNKVPDTSLNEIEFIISILLRFFPYSLADEELCQQRLPDIATKNKPLGEVIFFDAFFADTIL